MKKIVILIVALTIIAYIIWIKRIKINSFKGTYNKMVGKGLFNPRGIHHNHECWVEEES